MELEGTWYNELGSWMTINHVSEGGFTGTYNTAVSSTGCAEGSFALVGLTDTDSAGQAVAFTVCWQNNRSDCDSVTAWSGQLQNVNGEDQISTFWLLTVESSPDQDWYATHVGQDVFTRAQPKPADVAKKVQRLPRSHP